MQEQDISKRIKEKKWIYEEIVERLPPFSWLSSDMDVWAQLMLIEAVGVLSFAYFKMPIEAVIFGTLAIIYTVVWSAGCLNIIPLVRNLKDPTHNSEIKVLNQYKQRLLLDRRIELVAGIVLFIILVIYLYLQPAILIQLLGTGFGNPILFLLIGILAWDISYRIGLSIVTTLLAAIRSIRLSFAARERRGLEYTAYSELVTLRKLDLTNLFWGASAILLLPLASFSEILAAGLLVYTALIALLTGISIMALETVPWLPPDILDVLYNGRFAYVGVCASGEPHVTPVIFVYDGKSVYFAVSIASGKYRLLKKNDNVGVLVDLRDSTNPMNNRTVLIRGKGTLLGELSISGMLKTLFYGLWMLRVRYIFTKKYPIYTSFYQEKNDDLPAAWRSRPFLSRVLVRVDPEEMTYWREARPTPLRV